MFNNRIITIYRLKAYKDKGKGIFTRYKVLTVIRKTSQTLCEVWLVKLHELIICILQINENAHLNYISIERLYKTERK